MQKQITLFLSPIRATRIAIEAISLDERFDVIPGVCRWDDGSTDQGFKVRIVNRKTFQTRYL